MRRCPHFPREVLQLVTNFGAMSPGGLLSPPHDGDLTLAGGCTEFTTVRVPVLVADDGDSARGLWCHRVRLEAGLEG